MIFSDGAAFKTFTTLNISLRLDLVKLYKTEDEEIKFLFEGQIQKPQEELPSGGENAKSWKTKIFQGADFDQIQLGCQTKIHFFCFPSLDQKPSLYSKRNVAEAKCSSDTNCVTQSNMSMPENNGLH